MSQVIRKYSNGKPIKLDDNQLFQREGFGAYKREDIANNLAKGLELFIADEKMNEKDAQMFRLIVGQAIEGTRNGLFTKMDTSGIHNTMNLNSNGITEGKKFLGINVGGLRAFDKSAKTDDGRNNALNALNRYYTKTLDSMSTYNYDNELKAYNEKNPKTKYNANTFFTDAISREWYGGNGIDWDNYSKNRTEEDRINLLNSIIDKTDYNELFNKYDWSGTNIKNAQDIANLYRALGTNLSNKTLDNGDYNAFAALGGTDLNLFLTGKKATETPIEDNPRVIREKALREEAKTKGYDEETANKYVEAGLLKYDRETNQKKEEVNEEYKNLQYLNWANEYSRNNPFKETIQSGFLPETLTYKPEELNNPIKDFYNNNVSDYLNDNLSRDWFKAGNTLHIANQLDFITNKLGYKLPDAGDGFVAIPSTYDFNNYSTIVYNPQTRLYKETSMLATDALKTLFKEYYDKNIVKHKEGGIIIMLFGGDIQNNYNKYLLQSKAEKENRKQQEVEAKAKSNNRTIQLQKESERKPGVDGKWTTEDKVILGSIVADIASMGASYVPVYGTLASAGLGIGSSLANYSTELSRNGFNLGDLGNLAINLGLDTVGLVPGFGSAAKGSKILKTAAKYLPRILATASLANTPEVYLSVKKAMTPGTDLTVDDWRNIAEGFKMAIQGGRGVKRTVQAHNLKKDLATGNKVLTTLGGKEVSVTPSQLSEISSHRKLEDQEAALQLLLKDNNLKLAGDLHRRWYNPIGWLPNSNIRNEYDFSKTKKVRTSKGDIDVPIIHSNSDKYIAATMQQSTAKIPGWDELTIKYNDWKYGSKENKNSKSGSKKSNKKKKTSKDNRIKRREWGGLLFKDGGLIPKFQSPAGPIRMLAKSKNYFDRNTGLSGYNFGADVDEFLKHGTAEDYVIGFNGREDNYDALTKASGGTYNNRSYISNPLATTVQSGMLTYNPGYDKYIRQNIQGYGVTEGLGTGTDTYLGDRTWERTLGRNITPELAKYFNDTYLNLRGMELFDKGDGGYRLRLLSQIPSVNSKTTTEQKSTPATAPSTTSNTENGLVGTSNSTSKNPKGNFSLYPEDVLSLGRMLGGLYTNSRIAKLHKRGLKPLVEDPAEQLAILTGDISGKIASEQLANSISDAARLFGTSDAQTYLSGLLEAKSKEAPIRLLGIFRDIDAYNKSRYLVNQIANQNTVERVNKANKNRTAALAIDNAKNQIDASEISANYAQVLAPWLAGIENKYAQNRAVLKQYLLESSMNNLAAAYLSELTSLYDKYKDNAVEFNKQKQLLDSKYKQLILDEKKSLISNPWLINFAKSGSKLGYKEKAALQRAKDFNKRLLEDNKRFHKDIMESKREHNKLLKHMSSLTAALIKKGLNL